jgi:hypothetical protein
MQHFSFPGWRSKSFLTGMQRKIFLSVFNQEQIQIIKNKAGHEKSEVFLGYFTHSGNYRLR